MSQLLPGLPGSMIGMSTPNSLPPDGGPLERPPVFDPCAMRLSAVAATPALVSRTRPAAALSPLPWQVGTLHFAVKIGRTSRQKLTVGSMVALVFGPTRKANSRF